jgi:hypothetical protein
MTRRADLRWENEWPEYRDGAPGWRARGFGICERPPHGLRGVLWRINKVDPVYMCCWLACWIFGGLMALLFGSLIAAFLAGPVGLGLACHPGRGVRFERAALAWLRSR